MLAVNKARAKFYPFNEVYLEAPKKAINLPEGSPTKHQYVRLDSYNPHTGEIVSRKYNQYERAYWNMLETIIFRLETSTEKSTINYESNI